MKSETKYYLCTFYNIATNVMCNYTTLLLDYHPIEYVSNYGAVLINHIEVTKDQYKKYHMVGLDDGTRT